MPIQTFSSLDDAIALAEFAHRNQRDQSGAPYIRHPMRVLAAVQEQGAPPYVQIAAVLHDVTEDSAYTPQILLDLGVLPAAVDIVKLLDRHVSGAKFHALNIGRDSEYDSPKRRAWYPSLGPDAQDEFYYAEIRNNPGALQGKLADIGDNRLPWRVVYLPRERQIRLDIKYTKALKLLTE